MTTEYVPLVQDRTPLNEVKYAARDFPSLFDSLMRRAKVEYAEVYNDFATTSVGVMLMDLAAYGASQLQWYLDRRTSDVYLETARTRAAVARLVKQIGYKMTPAAASGTALSLTFTDGTPSGFVLTSRWRFSGPDGMQFESYADKVIPAALSPGDVVELDARQGQTRLITYTSDGSSNQQYRLTGITADENFVAEGSVEVWVDGLLWEEKDFLEFEKTNQYEVGYVDDPPVIQFGDGIAGNIPPATAEVKIRYLIIEGAKGNVKANTITQSIDTLVIGGSTVDFTVNNPYGPRDGADPETAESAKRAAPQSFAARGAAITAQDYDALSNSFVDPQYGTVAKAYAYNPRSAYEDLTFNGLIDNVQDIIDVYVTFAGTVETNVNSAASDLDGYLTIVENDIVELGNLEADLTTDIGTAQTNVEAGINTSSSLQAKGSVIKNDSTAQKTLIDDLSTWMQAQGWWSGLSGADQTRITGDLTSASDTAQKTINNANDIESDAGGLSSSLTTTKGFLDTSYDLVTNAAPTGSPYSLNYLTSSLSTQATNMRTSVTYIETQLASLTGTAATMQSDVDVELVSMHTRIGELFNEDCMSNYVQVPILSVDQDGYYTTPSAGLIASLQAYLASIKEVTQYVEVIDGAGSLVRAEIEIEVSVLDGFVEAEVISDIQATVLGMLKGRDYGDPLYLSTLYNNVKQSTTGIKYVNIQITGPVLVPSVIDSDGNLIPGTNQVITYGSLTITAI